MVKLNYFIRKVQEILKCSPQKVIFDLYSYFDNVKTFSNPLKRIKIRFY